MIVGQDIKKFLVDHLNDRQAGKSSHWEAYLQDFSYSNAEGFKGLQGFGGVSRRSMLTNSYHFLMQFPTRKFGRSFDSFRDILKSANRLAEKQNRAMDLDMVRQALTISLCKEKVAGFADGKNFLVIGDGFGVLSSLLLMNTAGKVISINLHEVLLVDYVYTRPIVADEATVLVETEHDLAEALGREDIRLIYARADDHALLRSIQIDMAFNIASMQEMDPAVTGMYFDDLRNCKSESLHFYCCNRVEKVLPDGTASRFSEYPWKATDDILVDELCPWHQKFYQSKPPFYRRYDGATRHRLARFTNGLRASGQTRALVGKTNDGCKEDFSR